MKKKMILAMIFAGMMTMTSAMAGNVLLTDTIETIRVNDEFILETEISDDLNTTDIFILEDIIQAEDEAPQAPVPVAPIEQEEENPTVESGNSTIESDDSGVIHLTPVYLTDSRVLF